MDRKYCSHEGLCLLLSLRDNEMAAAAFYSATGITEGLLANTRRLDQKTKTIAVQMLGAPSETIFENRLAKVWYLHHPFTRTQLEDFAGRN